MSLEKALREMVQRELTVQLGPLLKAVSRMERSLDTLDVLNAFTQQLRPLVSRLGMLTGLQDIEAAVSRQGAPARGRPARAAGRPAAAPVQRGARAPASGERACAVIGCSRPARSKGYCSAHYQKLRLLIKTNRRPADWKDDAAPHSVQELKLPRGRAAARTRAATPPPAPAAPPKPKAWVRKKGGQGMVSL